MPRAPDFDLAIIPAGAGYTVQVHAALGVGELRPQPFILPIDLTALPRLRRGMEEWVKQARVTRLAGSAELKEARAFGSLLFERLFTGEVLAAFRTSRATLQPGDRLRLRLRLPDPLTPLPWELIYDQRDNQFLALAPDLALVRYPEMPTPITPLRMDGPLQVVAVLASPRSQDYPPIKLDRELRRIEAALKTPLEQARIALDVMRGPDTLGQLRARMRRPVHVLHILCHGDLDTDSGEGVLIFEDADGAAEAVNAELLRMQLQKQYGQTRLVLLNACLGALPAGDDPFSSVGAALLRGGVPAVIAMQFELAEDTAAELARIFYAELIAGVPADLALTEARRHLYGRYPTRLDWAIPVLFLRADDGVLFEVSGHAATIAAAKPAATALPALSPGDLRLLRAHAAALTERWPEALALYEELAAAFALPPIGAAEFARAQRETWLMRTRAEALEAETRGDWDAAVTTLEEIAQRLPDDADVAARLRQARGEQELAAWVREADDLAQAAEWDAVTVLLRKIEQRRPGYHHPTVDLAALGRGAQAALAYRLALAQAEQDDWAGVIATLAAVPDEAADDDLRALLNHARARQRAAEERAERHHQEEAERERQAALERESEEGAERLRQQGAARTEQETLICPACGKPNKQNSRFCATCGALLRPAEANERQPIDGSARPAQADGIAVPVKAGHASQALDRMKRKPWLGVAIAGALVLVIALPILMSRTNRPAATNPTSFPAATATLRAQPTNPPARIPTAAPAAAPTTAQPQASATSTAIPAAVGTWRTTGSLTTARQFHTATLLRDGTVLVAAGDDASAELYDPAKGTWRTTGSMATARDAHTATLLRDGTVLVVGGFDGRKDLASAELYDPAKGTWHRTGSMTTARDNHTATLLQDGTVLVVGGVGHSELLASAELYDPAKGTWRRTGSMATARDLHTATLLRDGTVLVAGGLLDASAEVYTPPQSP